MIKELSVRTSKRNEFIDITRQVEQAVQGVREGVVTVFVPHTTAAVTINENADPSVVSDILGKLAQLVPEQDNYSHAEGNSDAHIKSSLLGSSLNVIVKDGKLMLGTWQGIYLCEFDGPRTRRVIISLQS
ncbi:hypothetical protein COV22_03585 [Candidatus Woesearchaeota archaeon CG10_big_fil_rev_8_21_14_0_10_47_5]|nr:MAG: hypothetical protein COV22_03585 [Candidatus Woesearchaeota archaeon CG10_big_fil_rev_8_21_14_0_10_47_5]HII30079.1 YjbQ family protein [Candidatus Woesearchaeota archaeon]